MFISRLQLNPHRRDARWLVASPQRLHAAVLGAFPDPPTGDRGGEPRVLWRLDSDQGRWFLYVVSPSQPDFAHLAEQAGWPTTERGVVKDYGPLLDRLATGQQWAFRLAANPTRYERRKEGERAQRYGHVTVRYQEQWLHEKAEASGFRVTSVPGSSDDGDRNWDLTTTRREIVKFDRREAAPSGGPRKVRNVTLTTVQFDGRLEVTDPEALRRALVTGIGPGKAYGCGLLTLASGG